MVLRGIDEGTDTAEIREELQKQGITAEVCAMKSKKTKLQLPLYVVKTTTPRSTNSTKYFSSMENSSRKEAKEKLAVLPVSAVRETPKETAYFGRALSNATTP